MENAVAIVGMACRVPGSNNIAEFWDHIKNGRELISDLTDQDIIESGISPEDLSDPNYIKRKGIIENIDYFDAKFFNYSPKEAKLTDPQHRITLETCYHAMEDYGFNPEIHSNNIGVFLSSSFGSYLREYLSENNKVDQNQLCIANSNDFLATKIAYKFNLTGPAQAIQTACSSSLVAVHYACQSVLNYDCDAAIAGGISITMPAKAGYLYVKDSIASKDGHCRPFDVNASGTIAGNGIGIVVLKRLEDALASNDRIYGIIRGSAINNDGNEKMGYTSPSSDGQAKVITMAQSIADISPGTIGLIESHGTATILGDPIEIEGLKRAFNNSNDANFEPESCAITSSKGNIGHLDAAAGVVGLIKATLAVYNKQIPPSINFTSLNPNISFKDSPFYINTILRDWEKKDFPRRAGISAFGIGGTNVHVVIEEYNETKIDDAILKRPYFILPLSAKSEQALENIKENIASYLGNVDVGFLSDIEYTLQNRRITYDHRACVLCINDGDQLKLELFEGENIDGIKDLINADEFELISLWMKGREVSWAKTRDHQAQCATLPLYPFEKESYWLSKKPVEKKVSVIESPVKNNIIPFNKVDIKNELKVILAELLEVDDLDTSIKFDYMGADSLMLLGFAMQVEKVLNINITPADLEKYYTIDKLAEYLSAKYSKIHKSSNITKEHHSLVVTLKEGDPAISPLWCIHPAGGSVTIFNDLVKYLAHNQRVLGIRASGLYEGEEPDTKIVDMAQKYLKEIKALQPVGPYLLLGGSLGGTIAFEIAQCLEMQGDIVGFLGMMDSPPPAKNIASGKAPESDEEILEYIQALSPQMATLLSKMVIEKNSSQERFFKLWNCHKNSAPEYNSYRKYNGGIVYFRARERDEYLAINMERDWLYCAEGGVELYEVPGNHLTMYHMPNVLRTSEIINKKINNLRMIEKLYFSKEINLVS